jgi:hypothetical protein
LVDQSDSDRQAANSPADSPGSPKTAQPQAIEPTPPDSSAPIPNKPESEGGNQKAVGGEQAQGREKTLEDRIRASDRWMIGLTALGACAAIASAIIFGYQLSVMSRQLSVMEADNRPWISVEVKDPTSITKPNGVDFFGFVSARITNTGSAPAGDIMVWTKTVIIPDDIIGMIKWGATVPDYCHDYTGRAWQFHRGQTLFPTESDFHAVSISLDKKDVEIAVGKTKRFMVAVIGCVTYTFYLSPTQHSTGFMYLIGDSQKDTLMSLSYPEMSLDEEIKKADVRIFKVNTGTYAD